MKKVQRKIQVHENKKYKQIREEMLVRGKNKSKSMKKRHICENFKSETEAYVQKERKASKKREERVKKGISVWKKDTSSGKKWNLKKLSVREKVQVLQKIQIPKKMFEFHCFSRFGNCSTPASIMEKNICLSYS